MRKNRKLSIAVFLLFFLFPATNYAYVDPNTGGYVFQMLFPILSVIVTVYLFFKDQAKRFLSMAVGLVKSLFRSQS